MKILLIEEDQKAKELIEIALKNEFHAEVVDMGSLQHAIEVMEKEWSADIVVCDYRGTSALLIRCLVTLVKTVPCIFVIEPKEGNSEIYKIPDVNLPAPVRRQFVVSELTAAIREIIAKNPKNEGDGSQPVKIDAVTRESINKVHDDLERISNEKNLNVEKARDKIEEGLGMIHDLAVRVGFAPEVQKLALTTVEVTIKVVGNKPNISKMIDNLRMQKGKYLASHSLMTAELCCAIAQKLGWSSAPTLFKLTLASILHDIAIEDNRLAQCRTMADVNVKFAGQFEKQNIYSKHTIKAAEYAKKFREIPPDVDTIVLQHHERPDGTGFPRGLFYRHISPLTCVFIVAEDLFHFFLDHQEHGTNIATFIHLKSQEYSGGTFKRILAALADG